MSVWPCNLIRNRSREPWYQQPDAGNFSCHTWIDGEAGFPPRQRIKNIALSPLARALVKRSSFPGKIGISITPTVFPSSFVSQNLLVRRVAGLSYASKRKIISRNGIMSYGRRHSFISSAIWTDNVFTETIRPFTDLPTRENVVNVQQRLSRCNLLDTPSNSANDEPGSFGMSNFLSRQQFPFAEFARFAGCGDGLEKKYNGNNLTMTSDEHGFPICLGEGSFGQVVLATVRRADGKRIEMAVKFFNEKYSNVNEIVQEYRIMEHLEETGYIPKWCGLMNTTDQDCCPLTIVMEAIQGITLSDHLWQGIETSVLNWFMMTSQMADGLRKIHKLGVIVNDIKSNNIMIVKAAKEYHVKFIDFGLATSVNGKKFKDTASLSNFVHIAPEVKKGQVTTKASDIYSLGVIFDEIVAFTDLKDLIIAVDVCLLDDPLERLSAYGVRNLLHNTRNDWLCGLE